MSNSFKVKVGSNNTFKVRTGPQNTVQVVASNMSSNSEVIDGISINLNGIQDNYVLQYDASTQSIIAVDPDQILSDAAADGSIPGNFINTLDSNASRPDNVDFDGGDF
jgi:hypothetical protein